mmetsp:Transcript_11642/g.32716  ORF Transcript_11642/g.32716 Transcript_11642/m.32716 type:complete len:357 (-) Transcript_11642:865-1935(-)
MAIRRRESWFEKVFGFAEKSYEATQRMFSVDGETLRSNGNGETFGIGRFTTPSLSELRETAVPAGRAGKLRIGMVGGDVSVQLALQENQWATFQVASQFNALEFVSPAVTPEDGVTGYVRDRTQGPACSIACAPALVYRNYLLPMPSGRAGQSRDDQLDALADLSREVGNTPPGRYFRVRNGYVLATDSGLSSLNAALRQLDLDRLRGSLRVPVHRGVQVTSSRWGSVSVSRKSQVVTQVFCSACSVAYSHNPVDLWEDFAVLVLEAAYEATLWAALATATEHDFAGGSNRVYLTLLGGGAFGNRMAWIATAMKRAIGLFRHVPLDVFIVNYSMVRIPEVNDILTGFEKPTTNKTW